MYQGLIIEKNKAIVFSGKMTDKTITEIIKIIPYTFPLLRTQITSRKRIVSTVIELINNIINHTEGKGSIQIKNEGKGFYVVKSSNVVSDKNLKAIKKHIKTFKESETDEIKILKNKYLFENPHSGKSAGVGLFEVALYSSKLDLKVEKLQKQLYLYSVNSEIK